MLGGQVKLKKLLAKIKILQSFLILSVFWFDITYNQQDFYYQTHFFVLIVFCLVYNVDITFVNTQSSVSLT